MIRKFYNWISEKRHRAKTLYATLAIFVFAGAMFPKAAKANIFEEAAQIIISFFFKNVIYVLGQILKGLTSILFEIISYNNFIYQDTVVRGWAVVRDFANMFFVVVLLAIAIATILSIESYNYKRALPRLFLMAILINFSKVIAGLFIDFAQIVTLTFASTVKSAGVARVMDGFGVLKMLTVGDNLTEKIDIGTLFLGASLATIFLFIMIIIIAVYVIVFAFRIVALWILIVLSPMAYLLRAWPGSRAQRYYQMWWDKFLNYVTVGPILMFFLWLAIIAAGQDASLNIRDTGAFSVKVGSTQVGTVENITRFIVTACIMVAGLMAAQMAGVAGGASAGAAAGWLKRAPKRLASGTGKRTLGGAGYVARKAAGTRTGRGVLAGASKVPILGRAATGMAQRLNLKEEKVEDEAKKIAKRYSKLDPRIAQSYLRQAHPFSEKDRKAKEMLLEMRPELAGYRFRRGAAAASHDSAAMQRSFDSNIGEDRDAVKSLKNNSWLRLAEGGVNFSGSQASMTFLANSRNEDALRAVREGYRRAGLTTPADIARLAPAGTRFGTEFRGVAPYTPPGGGTPVYYQPSADYQTKLMSDREEIDEDLQERNLQYQKTKQRVSERGEEFFESDEYRGSPDEYVNKEEYHQMKSLEEGRIMEGRGGRGVTLGSFGSGGRSLGVNLSQLKKALGTDRLPSGQRFGEASGMRTSGQDAVHVAGGIRTIIEQQRNRLRLASTPDEQRQALKDFGYTGEYADDQIEENVRRAMADSRAAIRRLSNTGTIESEGLNIGTIGKEGINIVNKEPTTFRGQPVSGLAALKHEERGHRRWDAVDPDMRARAAVMKSLSPEERLRMREEGGENFEEQVANAEAGMLGKDEIGRGLQEKWRAAREAVEKRRAGGGIDREAQRKSEEFLRQLQVAGLSEEEAMEAYDKQHRDDIRDGRLYSSRQLQENEEMEAAEEEAELAPTDTRAISSREIRRSYRTGAQLPKRQAETLLFRELGRRSEERENFYKAKSSVENVDEAVQSSQERIENMRQEREEHFKKGAEYYDRGIQAKNVEKDDAKAASLKERGDEERERVRSLDDEIQKEEARLKELRSFKGGFQKEADGFARLEKGDISIGSEFNGFISGLTDNELRDVRENFSSSLSAEKKNASETLNEEKERLSSLEAQLRHARENNSPDAPVIERDVKQTRERISEGEKRLGDVDKIGARFARRIDKEMQRRQTTKEDRGGERGAETKTEQQVTSAGDNFSEKQLLARERVGSARKKIISTREEIDRRQEDIEERKKRRDDAQRRLSGYNREANEAAREGDMERADELRARAESAQAEFTSEDQAIKKQESDIKHFQGELSKTEKEYNSAIAAAEKTAQEFSQNLHKRASGLSDEDLGDHERRAKGDIEEYGERARRERSQGNEKDAQDSENRARRSQAWLAEIEKVKRERAKKSQLDEAKKKMDEAERRKAYAGLLRGEIPENEKRIQKLQAKKDRAQGRVAQFTQQAERSRNSGDVAGLQSANAKIQAEKQKIASYDQQISSVKKRVSDIENEVKESENELSRAKEGVRKATDERASETYSRRRYAGKHEDVERAAEDAIESPDMQDAFEKEVPPEETRMLADKIEVRPEVEVNLGKLAAFGGAAGLMGVNLINSEQFILFRMLMKTLGDTIARSGKDTQTAVKTLANQIKSVNADMPPPDASPIEIQAVLDQNNMTQEDLKKMLQNIQEGVVGVQDQNYREANKKK